MDRHSSTSWVCVFGQPGNAWLPYQATLQTARAKRHVLNLGAIEEKFDKASPKPSGSCLHFYTTLPLHTPPLPCPCKVDRKAHVLDWYGDDEAKVEWRRKARANVLTSLWFVIKPTIQDRVSPPSAFFAFFAYCFVRFDLSY